MARSLYQYLKSVKSNTHRRAIKREAIRRGFRRGRIGVAEKEILQDAIFSVKNELEHAVGEYAPGEGGAVTAKRREWVTQMRAARNLMLDDLGWNENASRQSAVAETDDGREAVL